MKGVGLMKRTLFGAVSVLGLGAFAAGLVHCGGTGGGLGAGGSGAQAVNTSCNPDSSCLTLSIQDRTLAADNADQTTFQATLRDGSGNFVEGVSVCFRMEDPGMATIFEPADACGLTNAGGVVSGSLRAQQRSGSSFLIATATGLESREKIVFGNACLIDLEPENATLQSGDAEFLSACIECADDTVLRGATVTFSGCAGKPCTLDGSGGTGASTTATTANNGCATASLLNNNVGAASAQATITASEPTSGSDSSSFVLEGEDPEGSAVGASCTSGSDCESGACGTPTDAATFCDGGAGPCCLGAPGDPCDQDDQCAGTATCPAGTCEEPA